MKLSIVPSTSTVLVLALFVAIPFAVLAQCSDDPSFIFERLNGEAGDCEWLSVNDKRINRYCDRGDIKGACQATCSFCPCEDDPTFTFALDVGNVQDCEWFLKKNTATRRANYCYENDDVAAGVSSEIGNECVDACGFCTGSVPTKTPTKAPTKAPTKTPTKSPTKAPTMAPTTTPTANPSISDSPSWIPTKVPSTSPTEAPSSTPTYICSDDPSFRINLDIGTEQDCAWLTKNQDPEKLQFRINTYCSRDLIKIACRQLVEMLLLDTLLVKNIANCKAYYCYENEESVAGNASAGSGKCFDE